MICQQYVVCLGVACFGFLPVSVLLNEAGSKECVTDFCLQYLNSSIFVSFWGYSVVFVQARRMEVTSIPDCSPAIMPARSIWAERQTRSGRNLAKNKLKRSFLFSCCLKCTLSYILLIWYQEVPEFLGTLMRKWVVLVFDRYFISKKSLYVHFLYEL